MKTIAILLNHGFTKSEPIDVEIEDKEFDPSITDPTFFTPVGSMVRKLNSQDKVSQSIPDMYYDFADGKDNGMSIPVSRYKGVDVTEIAQEIKQVSRDVEKAIVKDSKRRKQEQSELPAEGRKTMGNNDGVQATTGQA